MRAAVYHRIGAPANGLGPTGADLALLVDLAEAGRFRAVRDRTFELTDIAGAHRYVETGRKRGNVVVRIVGDEGDPAPAAPRPSREATS